MCPRDGQNRKQMFENERKELMIQSDSAATPLKPGRSLTRCRLWSRKEAQRLISLCLRGEALLNLDVAGSGPHLKQRAAAADFAANRFTGFLHPSLYGHFDGRAHVYGARTGGNVGVE